VRLFVREPRGGEPRPITDGPLDVAPDWSPDGSKIVFQTLDEQGREAIAVIEPEGEGGPRRLARGTAPVFTPDGEWIVYSALTREGWRIWKMHADGTGRRPVGRGGDEEGDPAVSPDGRFVAFVVLEDERRRIHVRRLDGSGDRPLITDGEGLRPVW
jgi:Tol biopolymer transport system component